jgi:glycyl-tRNA synthetase (class II)
VPAGYAVTIDGIPYGAFTNPDATIRHRDTMAQERVPADKLVAYIEDHFARWGK